MNPLNSVAWGLSAGLTLLLVAGLLLSLRRPILARIGARNIPRRPLQSFFIVVGLTMSTTIFIASFSLGDTLSHSLQRHIYEAYGEIDQIASPPQLRTLLSFVENPNEPVESDENDREVEQFLSGLAEGDLATLIQLFDEGLPGIPQSQFSELDAALAEEPLVDGAEGVIFFPSVVRNIDSGQGSPLAMIFAVEDSYAAEFGIHDVEGNAVLASGLRPGVGNLFEAFSDGVTGIQNTARDLSAASGFGPETGVESALGLAALLGLMFQPEGVEFTLNDLSLDLEVLERVGLDTSQLEAAGIETISLDGLGIDRDLLRQLGIDTEAPIAIPSLGAFTPAPLADANLFAEFNLNTLSQDLDDRLRPMGLQMRQGQVFLSEFGALQLRAKPGDQLEIFIGPLPVRYQVKAIVKEAGPFAPLVPVVMFEVAEAQRLLFMSERINAIIVSNQGDTYSGLEHTDAVSDELLLLSHNPEVLEEIIEILSKPENVELLQQSDFSDTFASDFDGAPFFVQGFAESFGLIPGADQIRHVKEFLVADIPTEQLNRDFRLALTNEGIRGWLLSSPFSSSDAERLKKAFIDLNRFEVLPFLNKRFAVNATEIAGIAFGSLFWLPGSLSILAGVILIFLIFVLLAAERRRELGIVRAVGMRRAGVVQSFVTEGVLYDLVAALLGLGFGLTVAYTMIGLLSGLFAGAVLRMSAFEQFFRLEWSVAPASLVIAYCLGVMVTSLVVVTSAIRISRMNIVSAIRDLTEDVRSKTVSQAWRIARIALLILAIAMGCVQFFPWVPLWIPNLVYWTLILGGFTGLAYMVWEHLAPQDQRRNHYISGALGIGLLAVWLSPWYAPLAVSNGSGDIDSKLQSIILGTPLLLIGAILAVMSVAPLLARAFVRVGWALGPLAPAVQLAVAYPLSSRFRSGVAILLFSMVITTVLIMTQFIRALESIAEPDLKDTAGFDMEVSPGLLSVFDPLMDLRAESQLRDGFPEDSISVVSSVTSQFLQIRTGHSETLGARTVGIDAGYAESASQVYDFSWLADGYESADDVWAALARGEYVAVATENFLLDPMEFRPGDDAVGPDAIGAGRAPLTDAPVRRLSVAAAGDDVAWKDIQVIGRLEHPQPLVDGELLIHRDVLDELSGEDLVPDKHYAKVAENADPRDAAADLERALLSSAQDVMLFTDQIAAGRTIAGSVLRLFRVFFTLGLVVGMTGLAVISVRAVLERRQQIGMLRAIGYRSWTVAAMFLMESSFISLSGIAVGGAAGVFLGVQTTEMFLENVTNFAVSVPWLSVTVILSSVFGLALLASLLPSWQAARVYPAEALRYE